MESGQAFQFDLTLFGRAITLFPYVALSVAEFERLGLGRRLGVLGGRRGRARVGNITAINPFGAERELLVTAGDRTIRLPERTGITQVIIAARAAALPAGRLRIRFLSPARLISQGRLARRPEMSLIARRLLDRLEALEREYAEPTALETAAGEGTRRERFLRIREAVGDVRLVDDRTRWEDVVSHSARQGRATPIGGIVGEATYDGELTQELRELLVWGEVIHVGKNAVKGDGLYRIEA